MPDVAPLWLHISRHYGCPFDRTPRTEDGRHVPAGLLACGSNAFLQPSQRSRTWGRQWHSRRNARHSQLRGQPRFLARKPYRVPYSPQTRKRANGPAQVEWTRSTVCLSRCAKIRVHKSCAKTAAATYRQLSQSRKKPDKINPSPQWVSLVYRLHPTKLIGERIGVQRFRFRFVLLEIRTEMNIAGKVPSRCDR